MKNCSLGLENAGAAFSIVSIRVVTQRSSSLSYTLITAAKETTFPRPRQITHMYCMLCPRPQTEGSIFKQHFHYTDLPAGK